MKPGELTRIEDTLRRAYADAQAAVSRADTGAEAPWLIEPGRPLRGAGRPVVTRRWLIPAAAAAAVALVAVVAVLVVPTTAQPARPAGAARHMAYVVAAGAVIPVNLATNTALRPIRLDVPGGAAGDVITPDGRTVYVLTFRGYLVPVNTVTREAGRPIWVGGVPPGRNEGPDILTSPDGRTGYVVEPPYGVAVIDFALNQRAGFLKIHDAWRIALTPDGKILYVVNRIGSAVTPVNTATMTSLRTLSTPADAPVAAGLAVEIAVAPDGKMAYVTGGIHGALGDFPVLVPISTVTNTPLSPIQLRTDVYGPITFSPDSSTAYLAGPGGASEVDLVAGTPLAGGSAPATLFAISPDGHAIYSLGSDVPGGGTIHRIPLTTGILAVMLAEPGPAGSKPDSMVLSPDGGTLYVLSHTRRKPGGRNSATIIPVDAATGRAGPVIHLPELGYLVFGPS